ncbi:MAG: 16S rRNA processing protein RimM [Alphaproteobacteria bacterium]|nr:16S rRNA processing protein RimM [Alphaproteobacteria bacterium]
MRPGNETADAAERLVCVGIVAGAHGVGGAFRVKTFTVRAADIATYGPVSEAAGGRDFELTLLSVKGDMAVVRAAGVQDRDGAEALRGVRLHVPRRALPGPAADEFYHADLIGLRVELADGRPIGTVRAVFDFGAGDLLEVAGEGEDALMVPFSRDTVPVVDLAAGRLVVEPLPGLIEAACKTEGVAP